MLSTCRSGVVAVGSVACFVCATALAGAGNPISLSLVYPVGGETLTSVTLSDVTWSATVSGPSGNAIGERTVLISYDNGSSWEPIAVQVYDNVSTIQHWVKNKPGSQNRIRVIVADYFGNSAQADSGTFTIVNGAVGAMIPSTDRDFEGPGTQPIGRVRPDNVIIPNNPLEDPQVCSSCHGGYDPAVNIYEHWRGSMMAYAAIDPIWKAAVAINDRIAPGAGDICLRCHVPTAWLAGRSNPSDGRAMLHTDLTGVNCEFCHRLVDPFPAAENPAVDTEILSDLALVPPAPGNATYIVDPQRDAMGNAFDRRRGPFTVPIAGHEVLVSPFHQDAASCGVCHDVSNPAMDLLPGSQGAPNAWNTPHPNFSPTAMMSEQRTYSEWFYSAFNSPGGVYAPEFGGNLQYVATCQDCHMRDVTGRGCGFGASPIRNNQPLHDLTGSNAWMLSILDQVDPTVVEPIFEIEPGVFIEMGSLWIQDGINRVRYMLQNAATLDVDVIEGKLSVKVTNNTGHKLPTGYPEGRRIWINVQFRDAMDQLVGESGAYDFMTGELTHDAQAKIYEGVPVIEPVLAAALGLPPNTTSFLALSNKWLKDNRIPPLGFTNAAYASFGGAPVGATYADGQNWDISLYNIPEGAETAEVTLYHQITTKEYIEFLRDNDNSPAGPGDFVHNLWDTNGKAPPELMETAIAKLPSTLDGDMNCDGIVSVGDIAGFVLALTNPTAYYQQYPDCTTSNADINDDGQVSVGDIGPFVNLLSGG